MATNSSVLETLFSLEDEEEYLVLTDSEADDKWEDYLESYIDDCILHHINITLIEKNGRMTLELMGELIPLVVTMAKRRRSNMKEKHTLSIVKTNMKLYPTTTSERASKGQA